MYYKPLKSPSTFKMKIGLGVDIGQDALAEVVLKPVIVLWFYIRHYLHHPVEISA